MTQNEFKVGDYVRMKSNGDICQITDAGEERTVLGLVGSRKRTFISTVNNVERIDRRTAFLTRLRSLLREFDARIEPYFSVCADIPSIDLYFGNDCVESWDTAVNADSIMDFNKE